MFTQDTLTVLADSLATARSLMVLLPADATFDQVAAGVALTQQLIAQGKEVQLGMPAEPEVDTQTIVQAELIRQQLGNKNLQVSFAYQPEQVDKVSYHIDETQSRFYLVIRPQKGHSPLDTSTIAMDYTGTEADMVFLIGIHEWESLEHLYVGYEDVFQDATVVTLHTFEPPIGTIKLNISGFSGYSEAVAGLALQMGWQWPADAATNLLQGIEEMTDSFKSLATTAETFDLVAQLIRAGARRIKRLAAVPAANVAAPREQVVLNQTPSSTAGSQVVNPFAQAMGQKAPVAPTPTPKPTKKKLVRKTKEVVPPPGMAAAPKPSEPEAVEPEVVPTGGLDYQPTGYGPGGRG